MPPHCLLPPPCPVTNIRHCFSLLFRQRCTSHLHALYGEHIGIFDLRTMEMTEGDLPKKAQELVKEWMRSNQKELLEMWDSQNLRKLPPL